MPTDISTLRSLVMLILLAVAALAGCRAPYPCRQRHVISGELETRMGSGVGPGGGVQFGSIPDSVNVEDGLTADETVTLALWNNAAYHELLSQLGVSRAQLYDAGLITDPQLIMFFPLGPKQLEFATFQAIDALWLTPIRRRAAELDLNELSQQMVQNGLNTVRDARVAHANLLLAQERAALTAEAQRLRADIAALGGKRLEAGDISELEATSTRIEALQAEATAASAIQDIRLAQEQLRTLVGVPLSSEQLVALESDTNGLPDENPVELVAMATAMRPDLRAIEIRKAAACRRVELARKQFLSFEGGYDANGEGEQGYESGPALRMTVPVFNGNKGRIAIANALVQQVDRQYATTRDRIELEVRTAIAQLEQAMEQRQLVDQRILPALAEAEQLARRNYEDGGVPYFLVLQTTGQYVNAQFQRIEAAAAVRRAFAELERSVGRKLRPIGREYLPVELESVAAPMPNPFASI